MYQKVPTNMNFVEREKNIEKFWEDNQIFKKSMEHRKEGETYTFVVTGIRIPVLDEYENIIKVK